jgi:hypothetical protein
MYKLKNPEGLPKPLAMVSRDAKHLLVLLRQIFGGQKRPKSAWEEQNQLQR